MWTTIFVCPLAGNLCKNARMDKKALAIVVVFALGACAREPFIQSETPKSLVTYRPAVIGSSDRKYSPQAAADLAQGWCENRHPGKDAEIVDRDDDRNGETIVWRCR